MFDIISRADRLLTIIEKLADRIDTQWDKDVRSVLGRGSTSLDPLTAIEYADKIKEARDKRK